MIEALLAALAILLGVALMWARASWLDERRALRLAQNDAEWLCANLERTRADLAVARRPLPPPEPPPAVAPLTQEQREALLAGRCIHCGGSHYVSCPRVKRLRFRADGQSPLEVEYWPDQEWPKDRVVWIEDLPTEQG